MLLNRRSSALLGRLLKCRYVFFRTREIRALFVHMRGVLRADTICVVVNNNTIVINVDGACLNL